MSETNIVLCYPAQQADIDRIQAAFPDDNVIASKQSDVAANLLKADIFCGHAKVPVDWDAVAQQGRLKWIQSSAAGLDHCLAPPVIESDIVVSGCSALFANQVAEQTLALLMGAVRRMPVFYQAQQARQFDRLPTDDLHGKSVGIVGFGGNGRRIAETLNGMVASIAVTDSFPDFEIPDFVNAHPAEAMDDLFSKCDVIIVTLPLTEQTHKCIGEEQFSKMKSGSYFINVARGSVVNQPALTAAITNQQIEFAGLDVVDPEPLPDTDKLWEFDNVIITPHVGAQSSRRIPITTELFCMNVDRFRNGKLLLNQVDKQLQFPRPEHRLSVDSMGQIKIPKELV